MSQTLVVITGLIYLWIAVEQSLKGSWGTALMFYGYSAANAGVFLQVK